MHSPFVRSPRIASLACLSLLAACASSTVIVGKVRPAITAEQVKIYVHPPKRFEEIAVLESSSKSSLAFSSQGKMDVVMRRLKEEAAKVGANGVLLQSTGDVQGGGISIGTGSTSFSGHSALGVGVGTSVAITQKTGSGMAIYVEEE